MDVKREIFKPIFMNFPILDRFPIPSRVRARKVVERFREHLKEMLLKGHDKEPVSMDSDKLGTRLLASWKYGLLSEKQFLDNLTVTFVAGQENPQLALISTLYILAKHPVRNPSFQLCYHI
jgi:cytochrome P450